MGSGVSKLEDASVEDVATHVGGLIDGRFGAMYAPAFRDNFINGRVIAIAMRPDSTYDVNQMLKDVGVSGLHGNILIAELEALQESWSLQAKPLLSVVSAEAAVEAVGNPPTLTSTAAAAEDIAVKESVFATFADLKVGGGLRNAELDVVLDQPIPTLRRAPSNGTANLLECCMCLEPMHEPIALNCGHNGCKTCFVRAFNIACKCPVCRAIVPSDFKHDMHVNITLKGVIDKAYPDLAAQRQREANEEALRKKAAEEEVARRILAAEQEDAQRIAAGAKTIKGENRYGKYTYIGDVDCNGTPHGQGKSTFTSGYSIGLIYKGGFVHGKREGTGMVHYANGKLRYIGDYKADEAHGEGTFYDKDGSILHDGSFVDGHAQI